MSKYGCPYKIDDFCGDRCPIIKKRVEGFVMCEVDWESCPEYKEQRQKEEAEYVEYIKQLEENDPENELEIIYKGFELKGII